MIEPLDGPIERSKIGEVEMFFLKNGLVVCSPPIRGLTLCHADNFGFDLLLSRMRSQIRYRLRPAKEVSLTEIASQAQAGIRFLGSFNPLGDNLHMGTQKYLN